MYFSFSNWIVQATNDIVDRIALEYITYVTSERVWMNRRYDRDTEACDRANYSLYVWVSPAGSDLSHLSSAETARAPSPAAHVWRGSEWAKGATGWPWTLSTERHAPSYSNPIQNPQVGVRYIEAYIHCRKKPWVSLVDIRVMCHRGFAVAIWVAAQWR